MKPIIAAVMAAFLCSFSLPVAAQPQCLTLESATADVLDHDGQVLGNRLVPFTEGVTQTYFEANGTVIEATFANGCMVSFAALGPYVAPEPA